MFKFSGKRPGNLGVHNGQLRGPSRKPNSVCSHAESGYAAIKPLTFEGDPTAAWAHLKAAVTAQGKIMRSDDSYLYAEYSTPLMGYVDDVEFLLAPDQKLIHVRSASRLGYSDMGANRKRIENIRAQIR
jgi:uncharacterized protein (DUF1499 family)